MLLVILELKVKLTSGEPGVLKHTRTPPSFWVEIALLVVSVFTFLATILT